MAKTATKVRPARRGAIPSAGWWGDEPPPTAQWPGVTIDLPAVWRSATSRWESPDGTYFFDQAEADRACAFFPTYLRHHLGEFAGLPFTLLPYQQALLTRPIFGWKHAATGLRRFRKLFAFLPKGAGKSPWGAGTGLYLAFCDNEPGAEVYAVAADKKQARTVHDNARLMVLKMIEIEPEFQDVFEILRDEIRCPDTSSTYQVISADAATKHGFRPHGVIFDEMHAQKSRHLYEALKKSMVKRRQPLMVIITHAGHDDEGICHEEYDYAKRVLSGSLPDDTCLPVIFEMRPEDDWTDPAVWARVNPGHGITVKADAIAQECQEALHEPRKRNDFLMFHGNRWVNQATAWLPIDWWDACEGVVDDAVLRTLPVAAGLDMAQKWDLTAFVLVFREVLRSRPAQTIDVVTGGDGALQLPARKSLDLNYRIYVRPYFWIPEDTMRQHEKEDGLPYSQWVEAGLVFQTEGSVIDYTRIVQDITGTILPQYPLLKQGYIGYDPAFATDIATKLRDLRGWQEKVFEVLQNYTHLSEPSYILEALIKGQRVVHDGHRVLRSHVEHVAVKKDDAGRIRPVKPKSSAKRIDGLVATIMGVKALGLVPTPALRRHPVAQIIGRQPPTGGGDQPVAG